MRLLCCLVVLLSSLPAMAEEMAALPDAKTSHPVLLKGSIEHSERVAPVDKSLQVGAKISVGKLQALSPDNYWVRIPNWAAGSWKRETQTTYYQYRYGVDSQLFGSSTFMSLGAETLGEQKDRQGNVWKKLDRNYYTMVEGEKNFAVDLTKDEDITADGEQSIIAKGFAIRALVDKETQTVSRVFQIEDIRQFFPVTPNVLKIKGSMKTFDGQGRPQVLQKGIIYEIRIKPFQSIDTFKGRDLRKLFAEYLTSHGLSYLIPER